MPAATPDTPALPAAEAKLVLAHPALCRDAPMLRAMAWDAVQTARHHAPITRATDPHPEPKDAA